MLAVKKPTNRDSPSWSP